MDDKKENTNKIESELKEKIEKMNQELNQFKSENEKLRDLCNSKEKINESLQNQLDIVTREYNERYQVEDDMESQSNGHPKIEEPTIKQDRCIIS